MSYVTAATPAVTAHDTIDTPEYHGVSRDLPITPRTPLPGASLVSDDARISHNEIRRM